MSKIDIFVYSCLKQMILRYAYFQILTRKDIEMSKNEFENIIHYLL